MREIRSSGSVRGAPGDRRPYRDSVRRQDACWGRAPHRKKSEEAPLRAEAVWGMLRRSPLLHLRRGWRLMGPRTAEGRDR